MWAYLWNLWLSGLETVVHPEMGFVFSGAVSKEPAPILHMAGLFDELKSSHFDKVDWTDLNPIDVLSRQPYVFDHFPEHTIAREYATMIHEAADLEPRWIQPLAPGRYWRVLAWKTESKKHMWDVEDLHFRFEPGVNIVDHIDSGCAGTRFKAANAFNGDDTKFWGGREEKRDGFHPCFYLGVELDREAIPTKIVIRQRGLPHIARTVVVQFSDDAVHWVTGHTAQLDPRLAGQTILYRSKAGRRAEGWRVVTRSTSGGFSWDVKRLRFLSGSEEEDGKAVDSDNAIPDMPEQYGPDNAFLDTPAYWGGRPDENGDFHLGLEATTMLPVNRILLEQCDDHWVQRIEVQVLGADGDWTRFREVENLGPGVNDILLFELADPSDSSRTEPMRSAEAAKATGSAEPAKTTGWSAPILSRADADE